MEIGCVSLIGFDSNNWSLTTAIEQPVSMTTSLTVVDVCRAIAGTIATQVKAPYPPQRLGTVLKGPECLSKLQWGCIGKVGLRFLLSLTLIRVSIGLMIRAEFL